MMRFKRSCSFATMAAVLVLGLSACAPTSSDENAAIPPVNVIPPEVPPEPTPLAPVSEADAASFLMTATFGPTQESIQELSDMGYSDWFRAQLNMPISSILAITDAEDDEFLASQTRQEGVAQEAWYDLAIEGEDQLRQRAAFALSQIFVVSTASGQWTRKSHLAAAYKDTLQEHAFGNYRDLMQDVTYSPLMGSWLTYLGNKKADPDNGSVPDENYAREILQLFTIGLIELNPDGTPRLDANGQTIETYTNEDITELAKVFTGLWWGGIQYGGNATISSRPEIDSLPMEMNDDEHSPFSKTFLGSTIGATTDGNAVIAEALDIIFEHPNIGPFVCTQLIQRMTTSNPTPDYVERVVNAFETGTFVLPDDTVIGSGERGDLAPVWAAILLDPDVTTPDVEFDNTFGKVREPVIRFIHWARAAGVDSIEVTGEGKLRFGSLHGTFGQDPFRSPSVFNFYRPGFVAAGLSTADAGLVAPELQITTAPNVIKYTNFMEDFTLRDTDVDGWNGQYEDEIALAGDPDALVEHLNLVYTAGRMDEATKTRIRNVIESAPEDDPRDRAQLAVLMTVTAREFITQQ